MKQILKRSLCALLALVMLAGLCACGSAGGAPAATAEPEEYVYAAKFTPLEGTPENGLSLVASTEEGLYAQTWEKVGEREIPDGAQIHFEGEYDIFGPALYFIGYDGSLRRLEQYSPLQAPEDDQGRDDYYGSSNLDRLLIGSDGSLIALEELYISWFDGPESERNGDNQWAYRASERHYYIRRLDADGAELSCSEMDFDLSGDAYLNLYNAQLDEKGNILCTTDMMLLSFTPDGKLNYSYPLENYPDSLLLLNDGRVALTCWGDTGEELYYVDPEARALGEKVALPTQGYSFTAGGGGYDLMYTNGSNLFGLNFGEENGVKLLNWINVDVDPNQIGGFHVDPDGSILGLVTNWSGEKAACELFKIALVPASSLPVKQTLSLAVMYMDYQMQSKIIDFNRHSDTTRIEVRDYSEFNTEDDYTAGITKLTTEIMAGNMPDLLSLNGLPYDQLASKGLLEDLYPYLDADEELNREDFFPTVLQALEYKGGLYQVAPSFQILTLIGASSVVGDTPGWTYDDFNAALATMPAGCSPLDQYTTRGDILSRLVTLEMDRLVDWTTGKCSFDSQEYIDILNFANRFQATFDWDHYEWSEDESAETRIAEGRQMLMAASIYSVDDLLYNDFYFGGDATYIGYPTSEGAGSMMTLNSSFGMSANCADKAAAWAFLRAVLSEEYQENIWGLPINVNAFNKKLEESMTPQYQLDSEGNYVLDSEGERVQISRGGVGMADGTVHNFYAMTQEQADKLLEVINTTTRVVSENDSLINIVLEEAEPFFLGQKSAEEVARLTQSKVSLYVNEQR